MKGKVVVIGLGEIGKPLLDLIGKKFETVAVDIQPVAPRGQCDVMHICFPFEIDNFVKICVQYIEKYRPSLTIISSTVAPGTTRQVSQLSGTAIVHSPVRGKHMKMRQELLKYTKFVGSSERRWSQQAARHFQALGMKTKILPSPEATELAKLTETTYFGLLIAWAQEVERYCTRLGLDYDDVVSFYEEIGFLPPVKYFPGVIGGHCVMQNVKTLKQEFRSDLLNAIENSNELKQQSRDRKLEHRKRRLGLETAVSPPPTN